MKTKNILLSTIVVGLLTSCSPSILYYYQLYKTSNEGLKKNEKTITYEDEYCQVSYDLWGDGGKIGFHFYNKTDQNIYLNLDESFFILNGNAFDYYKNRSFTNSSGSGTNLQTTSWPYYSSMGFIDSKGYSVTINEEKVVCVPSKTSKIISEYTINQTPYRDCDLLRFPDRKQTAYKSFNKSNSPYVFSNRIVYRIGQNDTNRTVVNEFYVTEISNLTEEKVMVYDYKTPCGEETWKKSYFFKRVAPDMFYIKYEASTYESNY
jgi:hypothetical protein